MLPRAVEDLYTRWLAESTYRQQASVAFAQQKKDQGGRIGEASGGLAEKVAALHGKPVEIVGGLVKQTFEGLAKANQDLVTGGLGLPRLQIDQSRELLALVEKVSGRPPVLALEQWKKSPALDKMRHRANFSKP